MNGKMSTLNVANQKIFFNYLYQKKYMYEIPKNLIPQFESARRYLVLSSLCIVFLILFFIFVTPFYNENYYIHL